MKIDVGRNDPCPCGSGVKFKRCCADDPMCLFPKYISTSNHHWSLDDIRGIPTDKIIEKLEMSGVRFKEEEFVESAKNVHGAQDIYEQWQERFIIIVEGTDEDFVWMACEVLWERLVPGKKSTEQIDDMMQEGYDAIGNGDVKKGCELWLRVWEELKPRFTPEMRDVDDGEEVFDGLQCLFNWCQDVEQKLGIAAADDSTFHDRRIRYCREFCRFFPDTNPDIIHNMRRAIGESLFRSGKQEDGEREFQSLVNDYPQNPWGYVGWGDMYAGLFGGTRNFQRAEELYTKALGINAEEDKYIRERLRDLKKKHEEGS